MGECGSERSRVHGWSGGDQVGVRGWVGWSGVESGRVGGVVRSGEWESVGVRDLEYMGGVVGIEWESESGGKWE